MNVRHLTFAAALLAAVPFAAIAQGTTLPSVSDSQASEVKNSGSPDQSTQGATGSKVGPGSNGTVAGDKGATAPSKTDMAGGNK